MSLFEPQDSCCKTPTDDAVARSNRPGLSEITYRLGTHGSFKADMLQAVSAQPALDDLTSRDSDDASIALLDGWASVLDVLSFYQERIANEAYLAPATERRSVLELARTIGYELNPGVAAATYLAFSVEEVPGIEDVITIDAGLKVQSTPGQDELPQTFETTESIDAYPELNRIQPLQAEVQLFTKETDRVFLAGMNAGLQNGDLILLAGASREASPFSERWDVRTVHAVNVDPDSDSTEVIWKEALGHTSPSINPADQPTVYAFREVASLFGYNAPDWRLMSDTIRDELDPNNRQRTQWPDFSIQTVAERRIDLDAVYKKILPGSWVLLDKPSYRELYQATEVFTDARTDYTLTSKTTSLILDSNRHLHWYPLRKTTVYAASEALPRVGQPLTIPVFGDRMTLDGDYPQLLEGRTLMIQGESVDTVQVSDRQRIYREGRDVIRTELAPLQLVPENGTPAIDLESGKLLEVLLPPERQNDDRILWTVMSELGEIGSVLSLDDELTPVVTDTEETNFAPGNSEDHVAEVITIRRIESDGEHTVLVLEEPLQRAYYRASCQLFGNVSSATHGDTRAEIVAQLTGVSRSETLGSGDGGLSMQQFTLSQVPLTHVPAATSSGAQSTLEIRVDGIAWTEVPSLYQQTADAKVYTTRQQDNGLTVVMFGDGVHGARLPTGRDNISATYRVGIGLAGMVRKTQLQLLMSRPLGVKDVINPMAAENAQDPEDLDEARNNAPLTVLTLDRIVSVQDFEDFARAFAGIGKSQASVLWDGEKQIIHLSVGSSAGGPIPDDADLLDDLRDAIDGARHADQQVRIDSYVEQLFGVELIVLIDPAHEQDTVLDEVQSELLERYSYAQRELSQAVSVSEISGRLHDMPGVQAVIIKSLDSLDPQSHPILFAQRAHWDNSLSEIIPAVLLTIDPNDISIEVNEA
ncbi:MAG: hypothetical protein GY753_09320 [Gammaproteobacteria bacterium]|nr:hypothetical protein [Gammaproteobacteria bacterium]